MMDSYDVVWSKTAIRSLSKLYKINPRNVFPQSKYILSQHPHKKAYDMVNYPGFDFNGYYWILIDAVYFGNSKESAEMFWGIEPDNE